MLESFLPNRKQCLKNGKRHWIIELGDNHWQSISKNGSQTFKFHYVYKRFPNKNDIKRRRFTVCRCIFGHSKSKSDEILLWEIISVFEHTDSYTRQNMLTLNRDQTEIVIFSKNDESKIEQLHYNGIFIEPKKVVIT